MSTINVKGAVTAALMKFTEEKWHCAEAVLYGLLSETKISNKEHYLTSMSGFSGGFGGTKNMCGALSGGAAALGCLLGRYGESIQDITVCTQCCGNLYRKFQKQFETVICSELTKNYKFDDPQRRLYCRNMVEFATKTAAEQINIALNSYNSK